MYSGSSAEYLHVCGIFLQLLSYQIVNREKMLPSQKQTQTSLAIVERMIWKHMIYLLATILFWVI